MESHNKQSKDAKIMMAIMQDMGIQEYEPKVIHQMLEYTYRWEFIQTFVQMCSDKKSIKAIGGTFLFRTPFI